MHSKVFTRQFKGRASRHFPSGTSDLTIIAQPVFPYRPVISASDIYELYSEKLSPLRRVEGGISCVDENRYSEYNTKEYLEFNEYGVVYRRIALSIYDQETVDLSQFLSHIKKLIQQAVDLYRKCEYLGNIEIAIQLQEVYGKKLLDIENPIYSKDITANLRAVTTCFDTEVFASIQCFARDLESKETRKDLVEDLMCQLLWTFNIPIDKQQIREKVRERIERDFS